MEVILKVNCLYVFGNVYQSTGSLIFIKKNIVQYNL